MLLEIEIYQQHEQESLKSCHQFLALVLVEKELKKEKLFWKNYCNFLTDFLIFQEKTFKKPYIFYILYLTTPP